MNPNHHPRLPSQTSSILTVFLPFIAVAAMMVLFPSSSSSLKTSLSVLHQVPEGHVGVYWRGGALSKTTTEPGFHLKMSFITQYEALQVTLQTNTIGEKMKDALQVDCTRHAPGIEVIGVRVTKPAIPDGIRRNFEQTEEQRTKVLIAIERQKVAEIEAETSKKMAISEAEKDADISKILMEQKLAEKEASRRQQEIVNHIHLEREKSLVDAYSYRATKEAEANRLMITPKFLLLKFIETTANNTKTCSGNKRLLRNAWENMFIETLQERSQKLES